MVVVDVVVIVVAVVVIVVFVVVVVVDGCCGCWLLWLLVVINVICGLSDLIDGEVGHFIITPNLRTNKPTSGHDFLYRYTIAAKIDTITDLHSLAQSHPSLVESERSFV